jgi:hypothetical protein
VWFKVSWPTQGELNHCSVYRERSRVFLWATERNSGELASKVPLIKYHFYSPPWSILHYATNSGSIVSASVPVRVGLWFESWLGQQSSLGFLNSSKQYRENTWKYVIHPS